MDVVCRGGSGGWEGGRFHLIELKVVCRSLTSMRRECLTCHLLFMLPSYHLPEEGLKQRYDCMLFHVCAWLCVCVLSVLVCASCTCLYVLMYVCDDIAHMNNPSDEKYRAFLKRCVDGYHT